MPSSNMSRVKRCFLFTVLFAFAAHGYRFLSASFGGDAALLTMHDQALYQVGLGRFLQPLYWLVRGDLVVPGVVGLFTVLFLALSCLLIADTLNLSAPRDIALLAALLATHETFAVTSATYLPWMDVYALSLLFALTGASFFLAGGRKAWLSPLFFLLSLGLYQSYLPCAAALVILALMRQTLGGASPVRMLQKGLGACAALLAGLVLYALVLKLTLALTGSTASTEYNGVGVIDTFDFASIPRYLADTVCTPIRFLFVPNAKAIASHTPFVSPYLNLALLVLCFVMLLPRARALGKGAKAMLLLLVLLMIPGVNFVQFIAQGLVSGLTIFAYVFFDIAALLLASAALKTDFSLSRVAARCARLLLCVVVFQNAMLANQLSVKRDLEFSSTLSAATRIVELAEHTEGYVAGETPVVLIGMLPSSSVSMERPGFEPLSGHQGARYTYAAAYEGANYWYFNMILSQHVNLADNDTMRAISASPEAQAMPRFPAEGCCQMVNGMLYIRLS
mgnify:FL=1